MPTTSFEKASPDHLDLILGWLAADHVRDFWDNSRAHKDDIRIFTEGRREESAYFDGVFDYWIGSSDGEPFCLLMTSFVSTDDDILESWRRHLSPTGKTVTIDFCIGSLAHLGRGLAASTLAAFVTFFRSAIEPRANTFLMDPDADNPRARHAYSKAGFVEVERFTMPAGEFEGQEGRLMVLKA